MDVAGRKEPADFIDDPFEKLERLLIPGAEDIVCNAPRGADLIGAAGAAQFRIGRQGSNGVAR
jgi:hypothetical protein